MCSRESDQPVRLPLLLALLFAADTACCATIAQDAAQHGDIEVRVSLDSAEQSGNASATVRIHARREVVWSLITSCPESVALVPGLTACDVLETAPDRSWQRIRHVMNYSWFVPKVTYEIRAIVRPTHAGIDRTHLRGPAHPARILGLEQRRRLHCRALHGGPGARILGAAMDRAFGLAPRSAKNAPCAALPC